MLDGYSMSDVAIFIRQACMAPLNKTMHATHFKQIMRNGEQFWQATSANDPSGQKKDLSTIDGTKILPPPLEKMDLVKALSKARKSVSPEDLIKQQEFTRDFGMEG